MSISEEKKKIVINNYFKEQCTIDTSIREAFAKGFELGLRKAPQEKRIAKWELSEYDEWYRCSKCGKRAPYDINEETGEECDTIFDFCPYCGAEMREEE